MSKKLSAEKAAALITELVESGAVDSAEQAIEQNPRLKPGLAVLDEQSRPVSRGSGPALLERR